MVGTKSVQWNDTNKAKMLQALLVHIDFSIDATIATLIAQDIGICPNNFNVILLP